MKKLFFFRFRAPLLMGALAGVGLLAGGWAAGPPDFFTAFQQELGQQIGVLSGLSWTGDAYLMTDKTLYAPGETVWISAFGNRNGRPMGHERLTVELLDPKGSVSKRYRVPLDANGQGKCNFDLTDGMPGGRYRLRAFPESLNIGDSTNAAGAFGKDLTVQTVTLPRVKLTLDFERKAYGPGEEVTATLKAFGNDNKPLAARPVKWTARLANDSIGAGTVTVAPDGNARIKFRLPPRVAVADGLLTLTLDHEGLPEAVARAIPIVLNRVRLDLLPEGGELVTGLPGQVAVRATNEFGEPADVAGYVTDERGTRLTTFRSLHDGLGKFALTPRPGHQYFAHLTAPAGTPDSVVALPEALVGGFTMQVDRQAPGAKTLKVTLAATVAARVLLVCVQNGRVVHSVITNVGPAAAWVPIPVSEMAAGVMQITLFDGKKIARAERLVMVNADRQLRLSVKTDRTSYGLRQKVTLTIQATDELGLPAPAALGLSVVDDQNLAFADDKQSNIRSWMLAERALQQPVREPRFYFDSKEKDAPAALDLVLLTHGWRRFKWDLIRAQTIPEPEDERRPQLTDEEKNEARVARRNYRDDQAEEAGDDRIAGFVLDKSTEEALPGALVLVKQAGKVKGSARANADGYYSVGRLRVGTYEVSFSSSGFQAKQVKVVRLTEAGPRHLNAQLMPHEVKLKEALVTAYRVPIVEASMSTMSANTLDNAAIMRLPTRDVSNLASTRPGVFSSDDNGTLNLKGSRSSGTVYFVNGVRAPSSNAAQLPSAFSPSSSAGSPAAPVPVEVRRLEDVLIAQPVAAFKAPLLPVASLGPGSFDEVQVREFAAPIYHLKSATQTVRTDFRSTLFWKPNVVLDANGRATVELYTGDAVTSYRVVTEGTDAFGLIGHAEARFFTAVPVAISMKLPPYLLSGDTVDIPLVLTNATDAPISGPLALNVPTDWRLVGAPTATATIGAHAAQAFHVRYVVGGPATAASVSAVFGDGGDGAPLDQLFQTVDVLPRGYPMAVACSGIEASRSMLIDAGQALPGSLRLRFTAFPTSESDALKGLERMLQQPHGCFEQTLSSTYPNAIVLRYLMNRRHVDGNGPLIARAQANLDAGYARLATFARPDGSFDWFGRGSGNAVLTAFALARFTDMRHVRPNPVIDRLAGQAHEWLRTHHTPPTGESSSRKAAPVSNGGDSYWRADPNIANAYVMWALSETDRSSFYYNDLGRAAERALFSADPYQLALLANTNLPEAYRARVFAKLNAAQESNGSWMGRQTSAMSSSGDALRIETTALAVLAGLRNKGRSWPALQDGVKYLLSTRNAYGGYGSSQSSFLALKALIAYDPYSQATREDGAVSVLIDGAEAGRATYQAGRREIIEMPNLRTQLTPGKHRLEVQYAAGKAAIPYTLSADWGTAQLPSAEACAVRLTTALSPTTARVGESCRLTATLRNTSPDKTQPLPMALIGLPAGLSPQPWQLRELQDHHILDYYELRDGRLACYFQALKPGQEIVLNLDLKAELPGTFTSPPSVAYLYYTDEHKWWVPGVVGVVR